jgi:hypothetical protein
VQQCVLTITLGHSYTNVATRMVEAQGCPGLVAKVGERWLVGQSPLSNNHWGPGLNEAIILWKGLGHKTPEVAQPLGGSPGPPEAWVV